jgi:hypothetical protein
MCKGLTLFSAGPWPVLSGLSNIGAAMTVMQQTLALTMQPNRLQHVMCVTVMSLFSAPESRKAAVHSKAVQPAWLIHF